MILGEKEQGFAEALLIGYKDDLDRNLVQAYSNTGVVHIIAISGLHLGLIYGLLLLLTTPLKRNRKLSWLRFLVIVASLWLFSILAGGGPSVLRSALMFSLMAFGEIAFRKTSIINSLAFSAFVLLCINPFWLWDVGFQLSYAAVLSIVLFFQPIYRWFDFQNKAVDFVWKLTAVTIAAQILTLPISIYHFHQMPLLFLVTNFIAVPLSSMILMGEILLCALFFLPVVAAWIGQVLSAMIAFLNHYIESLNNLPFSTWNFLSINLVQTVLLLLFALAFCYWLLEKRRPFAWIAFSSFGLFMLLRGWSFYTAYRQKQLIVYNVPKHPAIDIINGRSYYFLGDSLLLSDGFERNFHL
ncbi:MAG TPA: ComEC/Rec2 family competence protein, partial [Flavisolibacter sp.]|nr:ComEC/Rec2 family competence protein [Flavisolibacter sp.]